MIEGAVLEHLVRDVDQGIHLGTNNPQGCAGLKIDLDELWSELARLNPND